MKWRHLWLTYTELERDQGRDRDQYYAEPFTLPGERDQDWDWDPYTLYVAAKVHATVPGKEENGFVSHWSRSWSHSCSVKTST